MSTDAILTVQHVPPHICNIQTACREQKLHVASDFKLALYNLKAQPDAADAYLGLQMAGVQWQGDNIHNLI